MSRWLLDVNVFLDFVLDRQPFAEAATALWAAAERGRIEAVVAAHAVTTGLYIAARERGVAFARRFVGDLLLVPIVVPVDGAVLRRAAALAWPDFEDAVCAAAAEAAECDLIVSRDPRGFPDSPVLVVDPRTALSMIGGSGAGGVGEGQTSAYGHKKRRSRSAPQERRAKGAQ